MAQDVIFAMDRLDPNRLSGGFVYQYRHRLFRKLVEENQELQNSLKALKTGFSVQFWRWLLMREEK